MNNYFNEDEVALWQEIVRITAKQVAEVMVNFLTWEDDGVTPADVVADQLQAEIREKMRDYLPPEEYELLFPTPQVGNL